MQVQQARNAARRWVAEEGSRLPGFHGAYLAGSINDLPGDALLPATSDLDINVILAGAQVPGKREKFLYQGALLEPTYLPLDRVQTPEQVLADYHLAGGFRTPSIIADPAGHLAALQPVVSRQFARREWVLRRCEHARRRVLEGLEAVNPSAPFHEQAIIWLFAAGVTTHILLVAGLRNPTVRRRYAAVRDLLAEYGPALEPANWLGVQEMLLGLLGCAQTTRGAAEEHLAGVEEAFDAAIPVIGSRFPFASDISTIARPIAIDGSREMIEQGLHREAMFWIAVTASRCMAAFAADAPAQVQRFDPGYRALLAGLGIASPADLQRRSDQVRQALPNIWQLAETIMAATPDIRQ
jgi:hypothetical protein